MNTILTPNLADAAAFLHVLDASEIFTFQTFDDDKERKDKRLGGVFHGTLDQHAAALTQLQQQGAGVFIMVNRGDGVVHPGNNTCRAKVNVVAVRSLFVDLDGAPLGPVLAGFRPDIVIESSPERWHAYWLTDDCPLDQFTMRQKQIAALYGGDSAVSDLPRVMRLPGFFHQKEVPFMTHMITPG